MRARLPALAALTAAAALLTSASATGAALSEAGDEEAVRCSDSGAAVALGDDGRILVGGSTYTNEVVEEPSGDHGHVGDFSILRYTARGTIDRSFGDGGHTDVDVGDFDGLAELAVDGRGRVIGAGSTRNVVNGGLGPFDVVVWRHLKDGSLDPAFGDDGSAVIDLGGSEQGEAVAVDRRGRVLVAGLEDHGDHTHGLVLRLTAEGVLDPEFADGGKFVSHDAVAFDDIHVDRSGRITVGGRGHTADGVATAVTRLNDDGSETAGFGEDGTALVPWPGLEDDESGALALDRDGRILAATAVTDGSAGRIGVVRLNRVGELDTRWGIDGRAVVDLPSASDAVGALASGRAGELVLAATSYPVDFATGDAYLAKLGRRGEPAAGFGLQGLVRERFGLDYSALNGVAIQPDGRIVAAGWNFSEAPERLPDSDVAVVRYLPDGSRDRSFGRGGLVLTDIQGAPICERYEH